MQAQVVVWNNDARYKAELEVEIELVLEPAEIPGFYMARRELELEVEAEVEVGQQIDDDDLHDAWFLSDEEIVAVDEYTVYDEKPDGYSTAYKLAI